MRYPEPSLWKHSPKLSTRCGKSSILDHCRRWLPMGKRATSMDVTKRRAPFCLLENVWAMLKSGLCKVTTLYKFLQEIGRASSRERVYNAVVEGAYKGR